MSGWSRSWNRRPAAEKLEHARPQRTSYPQSAHRYRCEHCGTQVTAQDAAAHATRCANPPRDKK